MVLLSNFPPENIADSLPFIVNLFWFDIRFDLADGSPAVDFDDGWALIDIDDGFGVAIDKMKKVDLSGCSYITAYVTKLFVDESAVEVVTIREDYQRRTIRILIFPSCKSEHEFIVKHNANAVQWVIPDWALKFGISEVHASKKCFVGHARSVDLFYL